MGNGFNVFNLALLIAGIVLIIAGVTGKTPAAVLQDSLAKVREPR